MSPRASLVASWHRPLRGGEKRRLTVEILRTYVTARMAMRSNQLVPAAQRMRAVDPDALVQVDPGDRVAAAVHLASAVTRVVERLPTDSRCLVQSLVLTGALARRGIAATVVVAVRTEPAFAAHAWVELDGFPLLPAGDRRMERLVEV